jgi:hypothetical protein
VLLALAMCASLGLHWATLQAVAWTQMLVTYSQRADFGEAVKKTFDGAHPCDLCLLVKQGQSEQKKQDAGPLTKKLDATLTRGQAPVIQFVQIAEISAVAWRVSGRSEAPPLPPPRA